MKKENARKAKAYPEVWGVLDIELGITLWLAL